METAQQLLPNLSWFDLSDPDSPDLDELGRRFHLHELQIEDCRHRPQRAKVDEYGSYLFAVLKRLVGKDQGPQFDDFDIFLGPDFLITVHKGDARFWQNSANLFSKTALPGWIASFTKSQI